MTMNHLYAKIGSLNSNGKQSQKLCLLTKVRINNFLKINCLDIIVRLKYSFMFYYLSLIEAVE